MPGPVYVPRRRRWPWALAAAALIVAALAVAVLVSWHFSSQVLVPDHSPWPQDVAVEAVPGERIALERTDETERPGVYGLDWQGGHAIVGNVRAKRADTVTRALLARWGYLPGGRDVALDPTVFDGNPREARGLPYEGVEIKGELGDMPAWLIPPARRTAQQARGGAGAGSWAIFAHGINSTPPSGLRIAPALRRAGLTTLLITYREDLGAPPSPDGYHHMGLTEWRDLQAAARYALGHGARRLVLVGYSMGGSLVTQFMQHSPLGSRVGALILDAPALNWQRILEFNSTEMGLPGFLAKPVEWAIGARIDVDWGDLDALAHTGDLRLPILLFHGTEDDVVPIETSDELAAALPRWVTYHRLPQAGHTQSWNVAPRRYEGRVERFLADSLEGAGAPVGAANRKRARPESGSK